MKLKIEKVFSEILDMLGYVKTVHINKIPKDLLDMLNEECDKEYLKFLTENKTEFDKRCYSNEALAAIAYINLKYWCKDAEEIKKYSKIYIDNNKKMM